MSSFVQVAALLGSFVSSVAAHGYVQGIVIKDTYYTGYSPQFQYDAVAPKVIGWSTPDNLGNGFVQNYNSPDIICHLNATPAMAHAVVAAGDDIEFQWTPWPDSHHGPVITYLAKCDGLCENVDKTTLDFFKIDAVGLINDTTVPGDWATDQLIANNNSWVAQIPTTVAPGNYVVRHEIIALHSAGTSGGAQPYPYCMNLQITGSGTASPVGTPGEQLYQSSALVENIYQSISTYAIPGPTLIAGASAVASQTALAINTFGTGVVGSAAAGASAPASTAAPATTSAAVTSAAAVVSATSSAAASYSAPAVSSSSAVAATTAAATSFASYSAPAPSSAAASSSAAVSAAPEPYTPTASATAALPSSLLTSVIPTAIPTQAPAGYNGSLPSTSLPEGMTFKQLLEWVHYLFAQYFAQNKSQGKQHFRAHPRDLKAF